MSETINVGCPRCESEDCVSAYEHLGELIVVPLEKLTVHCGRCGFKKVALLANRKVLCQESREPGEDETEVVFAYLGREPG